MELVPKNNHTIVHYEHVESDYNNILTTTLVGLVFIILFLSKRVKIKIQSRLAHTRVPFNGKTESFAMFLTSARVSSPEKIDEI